MACVYTFKDAKGQEVRLEGIPALKSYLVEGGLEEMFPERELPRSVADILGPQFSVQAWHGGRSAKKSNAELLANDLKNIAGVNIQLEDYTDTEVELANIESQIKNEGYGTSAMRELVKSADKHGVDLMLLPAGEGDKLKSLKKFYGRFGFKMDGEDVMRRSAKDRSDKGILGPQFSVQAWHGSPYDHDKFDSAKIGTGKGTQSVAHGLYFSSAKDVAEHYRRNLARKAGIQGKVYQVELTPNDDELLDWNKPLSEQSEKVQNALAIAKSEGALPNLVRDLGMNIYTAMKHRFNSAKRASYYLNSLGVRGVKYKAEEGGFNADNYVIFSDEDIKIVDKFSKKPQIYSQLREALSSAPDRIFSTGPQTKAWLKGNAPKLGIKADEIYWSGIEDFLDAQGKVSKQDVIRYLDENGVRTEDVVLGADNPEYSIKKGYDGYYELTINGETKKAVFETKQEAEDAVNEYYTRNPAKHNKPSLTLPGGKDYRETVVTIPSVEKFNILDETHFGDVGQGKQIAWTRSNVRTDSTGKDTLFLEEVQSQRGQEGRKKGFGTVEQPQFFIAYKDGPTIGSGFLSKEEAQAELDDSFPGRSDVEIRQGVNDRATKTIGVPPAPFITDQNNRASNAYISLLLKKSVLQAIENGQDSVSWTTGEQQADRYDLSKHVDAIGYYERGDAYNVTVWGKGTEDEYGPVIYKNESATRDDLEQNLGKELANKIINGEGRKDGKIKYLEDLDLKVGGEWAQSMYGDSQGLNAKGQPALITQAAREIAKRFGGKVGSVELSTGAQPALIITPEMKAKVINEGLPLFSRIRPDQTAELFEKPEDAIAQLTTDFGVGIQSLLDSGVLNLTEGKQAWPESARSIMRGDEEAVYTGGKIYIDLQHTAKDRLKAVTLHEIGEHFNLRKMLGSKAYSDLQNQIKHRAQIKGSVAQQMWNRVKREYPALDPGSEKFVAEVIARLGETNPNAPWYKRLLAQVKSFLLKHGLARGITAKTITENDIHELLLTSLRSAARGVDQRRAILYGQAQPAFSEKEGLPEKINIDGVDRWTVNSEGKSIAQNEEGIRNFWKWFGDSKVVDTDGKPLVVYHGTNSDFSEILADKSRESGEFFVTDNKKSASDFALYRTVWGGANVMPLYANAGRLLYVDGKYGAIRSVEDNFRADDMKYGEDLREYARRLGYDGIHFKNVTDDVGPNQPPASDIFALFDSARIKSALGNTGAFSEESNDIRFSSQPLPPAAPPTAQEQSHWYDEVKDKLDKFSDNLFRDRLSLFTVEQITELAQRYMPGLSQYNDLLQARTAEQSRWMRDADQLVSEKWRKLDKRDQARLHNTIQKSTLSDIDASRPWSGIEKQASGKTGAKQPLFYVYTQTTLSGRYQKIAARVAKGLKANNVSKAGAVFNDEATAKTYFERLQRIERNQQAFQAKYASGRENAQRKQDHASIINLYNALPEDAKYVYSKANDLHNAMFKSKLETHLENIEQAVENLEVRKQMVQEVRHNFENKKLNWYYAPLSRFGRHWLYGTTADGKKWYSTYETEQARAKAEETLKASGVTIKGKGTSLENLNNPSESGIDDKFIADITQLIAAANLAPEAQRELGDEIYQMYLSSLPDVSMRKNDMHRENTLGFSEDAMRSFSNAMHHGSSQLANMKYGRQMKRVLDDHERAKSYAEMPGRKQGALDEIEAMSELRDNWESWSQPGELEAMIENAKLNEDEELPLYEKAMTYRNKLGRMDIEDAEDTLDNLIERAQKVVKMSELIKTDDFNKAAITLEELAKSHDFMMNTASTSMDRVATALNQVNFVMMLGFSLSGGLVNMLQTPGAAIPIVLGKHSAAKTISAFNKAFMDFMSAFRHQLKDEDGNTSITQLLPERIRQAEREGRMADVKRLTELLSMLEFRKEDGTISRTQTFDIIGVGREGSSYGSPLQSFMQKAGWMFHHAERLNREVTLVAAYELARDSGKSHQEASDYAKWVTDRAHLNYTSENAARLFRGPLSRIALQFKKYTQGMMFLWGKTAADALASVSRDKFATEAEWQAAKAQKREAARTMAALFFMQTSMGGALGLPLMGVLGVVYGMLGAAVGDDDDPWNLERDLRLGLAKFIGDDAAEAATKGFINSFTPLNVSSRLDMADIFFRDPNKELEGRDAATHYVSEIMGATGGTVSKTWQGVKYLADGYYMRGAESLLPKAVSDLIKTARFAKEGARTLDDKPLREVSADELLFQIMGFGSSAQERMYAEREYAMQKQNAIQTTRSRIIHEAAKAYMNGEAIPTEARIEWNKKHPEWPISMDNIRTSVRRQRQLLKERGDKGYNTNPKLESVLEEIDIKP